MNSNGISILGVLQTIFIVLKCLGLVGWTWAQVFIPTFISLGAAALLIFAVIVMVVIDQIEYHSNR